MSWFSSVVDTTKSISHNSVVSIHQVNAFALYFHLSILLTDLITWPYIIFKRFTWHVFWDLHSNFLTDLKILSNENWPESKGWRCHAEKDYQDKQKIAYRTGQEDRATSTGPPSTGLAGQDCLDRTRPKLKIVYFKDKINIGTVLLGKCLTEDCTLFVYCTILICIIMARYILFRIVRAE
jgi:hypothetical protein